MPEPKFYVLHLNPEPWAVGSVSIGKSGGQHVGRISPNPNLAAFQNAVREALEGVPMLPPESYKLTFYFWRQQAKYIDTADRVRQRNQADATNLQKGLEDALQGVLFDNDRDVQDIRSVIVDQGTQVQPCIIIRAEIAGDFSNELAGLPMDVLEKLVRGTGNPFQASGEDKWATAEELF